MSQGNKLSVVSSTIILLIEIILISSYLFNYNPEQGARPLLITFITSIVGVWVTMHIDIKKLKYLFLVGHVISLLIFPVLILSTVIYYSI